ncbi:glycoside hydrolase family 61 protein [Mycena pura]|uniref:lytic cellulose monooxygenase (C4-dehydrogenating) n=1 Tax=Mycena pura TaxID=153505 RepID=A0AAD7E5D8_9AGAR|nr:glycoside hydrolase family 61 protein [Mycena pura]
MKSFAAALFSASLIASAAAHGWIGELTIAGKGYKGNEPTEETPNGAPSVIRQIENNLPVKDTTSSELTCGRNAKPAALVATVAAGATIPVHWQTLAANGFWFHDVGPMMTYLASCGSVTCDKFDASKAKWFKIAQEGQDSSGSWAQAKLDDGSPASVTLPSNLKAGNYLLRHEIVALHTAQSEGGAEFYPGCAQLTVTGSGDGTPADHELVSLPGAYKPTDPGILIDVYNMKGPYQFPGPAIAAFVSGAAPAKAATSTPAKAAASTKAQATGTHTAAPSATSPAAASGGKTCKGKRSRRASAATPAVEALDVRTEVRRSRVRHMHRAVQRSF